MSSPAPCWPPVQQLGAVGGADENLAGAHEETCSRAARGGEHGLQRPVSKGRCRAAVLVVAVHGGLCRWRQLTSIAFQPDLALAFQRRSCQAKAAWGGLEMS